MATENIIMEGVKHAATVRNSMKIAYEHGRGKGRQRKKARTTIFSNACSERKVPQARHRQNRPQRASLDLRSSSAAPRAGQALHLDEVQPAIAKVDGWKDVGAGELKV